jgi:hypothetical protein
LGGAIELEDPQVPPAAKTHVIYQIDGPTPADEDRLALASAAAREVGLDVTFSSDGHVGTLWSASAPEAGGRVMGALIVGASRAAHNEWLSLPASSRPTYGQAMHKSVGELIALFPAEPFYEAFEALIGGSQWSVGREELAVALFRATAELDFNTIAQNLTGGRLVGLAPLLGVELSQEEKRRWSRQTAQEVLERRPEIDYHQLNNPVFIRSDRGQRLARAYAHFCGEVAAKRYKSSRLGEKPLLPVSRYPVLAGYLEDMVRSRTPTPHASAVQDVVKLVLASDSVEARSALFEIICTPAPQQRNYSFPGPSEFEVRRQLVEEVWNAYVSSSDVNHRKALGDGLNKILTAYTSGEVAQSIVEQTAKSGAVGHGLANRSPMWLAQRTVGDLTTAFMNSGDHEMAATAIRVLRSPQALIRPLLATRGISALS